MANMATAAVPLPLRGPKPSPVASGNANAEVAPQDQELASTEVAMTRDDDVSGVWLSQTLRNVGWTAKAIVKPTPVQPNAPHSWMMDCIVSMSPPDGTSLELTSLVNVRGIYAD